LELWDAGLLQKDVCDGHEMKRALDRQQMRARNIVGPLQQFQRAIQISQRAMHVREILQAVHQRGWILRERRYGKRFFQAHQCAGIFAHILQNDAEIGQVASDGKLVVAFAIDGQCTLSDRKRFRVPLFVPAQQSKAAQRMTLERHVTTFPADA
jgi:hypothetical protein